METETEKVVIEIELSFNGLREIFCVIYPKYFMQIYILKILIE